jgi:serine phosphatase RsbU (regulator of sigma subunit)
MHLARPSLAWKIAIANILLALFAVLLAGTLHFRKDERMLSAGIRQSLDQVATSGALLIDGERTEALVQDPTPATTVPIAQVLRSMQIADPDVDRIYILEIKPNGDPVYLLGEGIKTESNFEPIMARRVRRMMDHSAPDANQIYDTSDGEWFSAFHTLHDRQGKVIAVLGVEQQASDLKTESQERLRSMLISGFAAAGVAVLLSFLLARSVTRPLELMAESTAEIAAGNLDIYLNIKSHDELEALANSFNQMVRRLAAAAAEQARMQKELLEKQKLDQELSLAAEIQRSFMPSEFPCTPTFCTRAKTVPAQVVGGDFYDFIDLGEDRQGIAIGDVAGRGIAAAVYVARLISDFRAAAARASSPRIALDRLNQQLLSRATRGLFVTMTYLVLEAKTGEVCYSTGGHLPILRRSGSTKKVEILYGDEGLPLGIEREPLLVDRKIQLAPGDTLLLVTDGVVEALDTDRNTFTMDRLAEVFSQNGTGAGEVVEGVFNEISRVSTDPAGDDLTVLAVTWSPAPVGVRI